MTELPLPPLSLRERVGCLPDDLDNDYAYLEFGRACSRIVDRHLPEGWSWTGKRVLDFGCGAGRTMRHFIGRGAQVVGCDIDEPSIRWGRDNLSPPLGFDLNAEVPPTPYEESSFDLIYAISVFSHLSDRWADWLVELHRILKPGGVLIASFMGEGVAERISGEPWDESRVGMGTFAVGQGWEAGGPMILLSPWWIREHWGRLFEIDTVLERGMFAGDPIGGVHDHGLIVARKGDKRATVSELQRIDDADAREIAALHYEVQHLRAEGVRVWREWDWRTEQVRLLEQQLADLNATKTLRWTRSLRRVYGRLRQRKRSG